jgi:hypothetical protein
MVAGNPDLYVTVERENDGSIIEVRLKGVQAVHTSVQLRLMHRAEFFKLFSGTASSLKGYRNSLFSAFP